MIELILKNTENKEANGLEDNALITLTTVQYITGADEDVTELTTKGKFAKKDGKYYIVYEESEVTGFEDTLTVIKVYPEKMLMTRTGKFNSKMEFLPGEKRLARYPTPYGDIAVAVKPITFENGLKDNGGFVKLEYMLDMNNRVYAKNKLSLDVKLLDR